jgi:hypothetical protein
LRAASLTLSLPVALALALAAEGGPASAETPPPIDLRLAGMSYVLSNAGEVALVIEAARAEVSPGSGRIELSGVRARLGALAGSGSERGGLEFACERGSLDLGAREFLAAGAVTGRLQDGREIRTERLRYEHARAFVSSDAPVALRAGDAAYRGGGFRYWVKEDRFRLTGGARAVQGAP